DRETMAPASGLRRGAYVLADAEGGAPQVILIATGSEVSLAVEAAHPMGWDRWVGTEGEVIGITRFGASAPAKRVFKELGFSAENVAAKARHVLGLAGETPELESGRGAAGPTAHGTDETSA
ncbi:MAG TPA: hypothetical protein VM759_02680, partial [Longimicrobium sp.]|nr:hypothetical protein [Longimicrobium sp.]